MLLKIKSDFSKLNKLVHDLLITDSTRPEVFVALSVLWERKDERGALSYTEKVSLSNRVSYLDLFLLLKYLISSQFICYQSIRIDERHIPGYIMKVLRQS